MKHVRIAAFATIALVATAVFASYPATADGIEVLSVDSSSSGEMVTAYAEASPMGSMLEAVMNLDGTDQIVDQMMIDPETSTGTVHFPMPHPANRLQLRAPDGQVMNGEFLGGTDYD